MGNEVGKNVSGGSRGTSFDEIENGETPLADLKRERYCQGVVSGADTLELYWILWKDEEGKPRNKKTTAMSQRSKLMKEPMVAARIRFLRGENAVKAKLGREEKLRITEEVIAGLRADFRSGMRGKTVTDLLSALQRHDAMVGDQEKPTLKIELGLGSLLENVEKLVEERQKALEGAVKGPEGVKKGEDRVEAAKPVEGEVLDV